MQEIVNGIWSGAGLDGVIVSINGHGVKQLPSERAIQIIENGERVDLYFTPAAFNASGRKAENALAVGSFWLDIDCGKDKPYATQEDAITALKAWLTRHEFPYPSYILNSGHGIHVYWVLEHGITPEQWKPIATRLKAFIAATGLHADPSRTADIASLMRLPGSLNCKDPEDPLEVYAIEESGHKVSIERFDASIKATGPVGVRSVPAPVETEFGSFDEPRENRKSDAVKATEGCAQLRFVRDTTAVGGKVDEPIWRAALSVWYRCEGGADIIHAWSKGDPRYDRDQTQRKADGTQGPMSCQSFRDHAPDRCVGCQYADKPERFSPILIGEDAPAPRIPLAAQAEASCVTALPTDPWPFTRVADFTLGMGGVQMVTDEGIKVIICRWPLWVSANLDSTDEEGNHAHVHYIRSDGRPFDFLLPLECMGSERDFKKVFSSRSFDGEVFGWDSLMRYISQYTSELIRQKKSRAVYSHLGWQKDESFVLGGRRVSPQGQIEDTSVSRKINANLAAMTKKGTLAGWQDAVSALGTPGYEPHAFALFSGFGSAILGLAGTQGAVLSLAGKTAAGKTLSVSAALSIYGAPSELTQSAAAGATKNAIEQRLSMLHSIPYLLDETTGMNPKDVGNLLYMMANGHAKNTLTRTRNERSSAPWNLIPMVTSNVPLTDIAEHYMFEAQSRRFMEFIVYEQMSKQVSEKLVGIHANYGHAADVYLPYLVTHRDEVVEKFWARVKDVEEKSGIERSDRFTIWVCAAAWTGGEIAWDLGLIDIPVEPVMLKAINQLSKASEISAALDPEKIVPLIISEWLNKNNARIAHWPAGERFSDEVMVVKDPIARVLRNGFVLVSLPELKKALAEQNVSWSLVRRWVQENSNPELGAKPARLFPGSPAVRVVAFREEAVGMKHGVLDL